LGSCCTSRPRLFPALADAKLEHWFALVLRQVRHQIEKRDFERDRNTLKHGDIAGLEPAFNLGQKTLSDAGEQYVDQFSV
jgi:hypothetical protein